MNTLIAQTTGSTFKIALNDDPLIFGGYINSYPLGSPSDAFSLTIKSSEISKDYEYVNSSILSDEKEGLYLIAVQNLRRKINFLHLNYDFQNGDISEEEFEQELEQNSDKYVVNVSILKRKSDLDLLNSIIVRLNDDSITMDEISEIFSIDLTTKPNTLQIGI